MILGYQNNLVGYCAMVTGGARGIGAGICIGLAEAGAKVAIVDLLEDCASDLADKINSRGGIAFPIPVDISSEDGCKHAIAETVKVLGALDILVNCAAPGRNRLTVDALSNADWSSHEKIVLSAPIFLAEAASEYLISSNRGSIINISSVTAKFIALDQCSWPYHVSKAGLEQLTRYLAARFGNKNIRCNAIAPGLVDRDVSEGMKLTDNPINLAVVKRVVPLGRAGTAGDIARAVIFLGSENSSYITGQVLTIDGGMGISEVFGATLRTLKLVDSP